MKKIIILCFVLAVSFAYKATALDYKNLGTFQKSFWDPREGGKSEEDKNSIPFDDLETEKPTSNEKE